MICTHVLKLGGGAVRSPIDPMSLTWQVGEWRQQWVACSTAVARDRQVMAGTARTASIL